LTSKTVDATATSKEVDGDDEESRRFNITFYVNCSKKLDRFCSKGNKSNNLAFWVFIRHSILLMKLDRILMDRERKFGLVLRRSGVAITVTSLTDFLAFAVGGTTVSQQFFLLRFYSESFFYNWQLFYDSFKTQFYASD
jgi:hypothetical protein